MTENEKSPTSDVAKVVSDLRSRLAGDDLPPAFAKLYSQHVKLRARQPGLSSWRTDESSSRLRDALQILEAGFAERDSGGEHWRDSVRRAGELLEWLSHPDLTPDNLHTRLLAAAAYQVASYPARSTGLLNEGASSAESHILRALLKADFVDLLSLLVQYWQSTNTQQVTQEFQWDEIELLHSQLNVWVVNKVASALGVLCAAMRWGNEPRLETAKMVLSKTATFMLYGDDSYSWLLASLCSEVVTQYSQDNMRRHVNAIFDRIDQQGIDALERYLRQGYLTGRTLAWPSQIRGIERILNPRSFVLCTPTGSGKTTVAELAILESLFSHDNQSAPTNSVTRRSTPLVIYLVPSRALAAEVEAKLARVLRRSEVPIINVTSLYGGTDWGPTDAWLSSVERTILICTYEKGEALIRFLGPSFWKRISLVIIDEAHSVQFSGDLEALRQGESRALRLESSSMRLLSHITQGRVIALSAVAAGAETVLAQWVSGRNDATPEKTLYRSTRQLIGRLTCKPGRAFDIAYDLLDGASLSFSETIQGRNDTPYIPNPFPPFPPISEEWPDGPEKRLRPYLFWAALQLAKPDDQGRQHGVLISIPQAIGGYADDLLILLKAEWATQKQPIFFLPPTDPQKLIIWETCLRSCEDYFTRNSREYRLLEMGIILHHGKMPGLLSRLLITTIQEEIVHVVLATSTLSEGVNLPFETILIPTLRRASGTLDVREFANLVGRAGRPGFGTEGKTLVLLEPEPSANTDQDVWSIRRSRRAYFSLIDQLQKKIEASSVIGNSPIARLLTEMEVAWQEITQADSREKFLIWLEQTAYDETIASTLEGPDKIAADSLDTLDGILLAAIVETEQLATRDLIADEIETQLKRIWQRSYAYYASAQETWLGEAFVRRGRALHQHVISDKVQRKRLYSTSLSPRHGLQLLQLYPLIKQSLGRGVDYAIWSNEDRIQYILGIATELSLIQKFRLRDKLNAKVTREDVLRWWLDPSGSVENPSDKQISTWFDFVSTNFTYRFNWAIGSIVALASNGLHGGELIEVSLEDWPQTELPWIVLWLKEILTWGTLEPVAAFLLARQFEVTRADAEQVALEYLKVQMSVVSPAEIFNPVTVRDWVLDRYRSPRPPRAKPPDELKVELSRDFGLKSQQRWRVIPIESENGLRWIDVAGYPLADSVRPSGWSSSFLHDYDFVLEPADGIIVSSAYI